MASAQPTVLEVNHRMESALPVPGYALVDRLTTALQG